MKEVQKLSNSHVENESSMFIRDSIRKIREKAKTGSRLITFITHNAKVKKDAVIYFKKEGFNCSVYHELAEGYGDIDVYNITINW